MSGALPAIFTTHAAFIWTLLFCLMLLQCVCVVSGASADVNATPTIPLRYRRETIDAFMQWMYENGLETPQGNITLHAFPSFGLGLQTHAPLAKNDVYMRIPHKLLLGVEHIERDAVVGHIFRDLNARFGRSPKYEIILFLLHEKHVKREASFWWPYIQMLPEDFASCPFFWDDQDLNLLRGSVIYEDIRRERVQFRQTFENLKRRIIDAYPSAFPPERITFDEYMWAEWVYSSRLFFIDQLSPRENLVPLADFINCEEPPQKDNSLDFVASEGNYLVLRADRAFGSESQIFESYGAKSNAESLRFEGFVNMDAPNDCIWLPLPWDQQIRQRFGYQSAPNFCFSANDLRQGRWPPGKSVMYLRYHVLSDSDRARVSDEQLMRGISVANERAVWKELLQLVTAFDNDNPFSEKQLKRLLRTKDAQREPVYLAKLFRIWEKFQVRRLREVVNEKLEQMKT